MLSPELAAGIRRVKGVKQLGARTGNWLTRDQASLLFEKTEGADLRSRRDAAMISALLGCELRRAELSSLEREDMQIRQGHWAIVDLVGKSSRTVPMPNGVEEAVDRWMIAAKVTAGRIFRAISLTERRGAKASRKMSYGMWSGDVPNGCSWITWLRMIFAERAQNCAM